MGNAHTTQITSAGYHLTAALRLPISSCPGLRKVTAGNPHVKEVRGVGLLVGVELDMMAGPVVEVARDMGMLAITAGKVCAHWGKGCRGKGVGSPFRRT